MLQVKAQVDKDKQQSSNRVGTVLFELRVLTLLNVDSFTVRGLGGG